MIHKYCRGIDLMIVIDTAKLSILDDSHKYSRGIDLDDSHKYSRGIDYS